MAVLVRAYCCGYRLKTGILNIAILGLLYSCYGMYSGIHGAKRLKGLNNEAKQLDNEGQLPIPYKFYKVVINLLYAETAFSVLTFLANCLLLGSYGTMNRFLSLPYIFLHIFLLAYTFGVTIFLIAIWHGFAYTFIGSILGWLLWIYFILVVYSFHEALREDPSGSSAGYGPPVAMVQVVSGPPPYAKFP